MSEMSKQSRQRNFFDTGNGISSPESEECHTDSDALASQPTSQSSQVDSPVKTSASPEEARGLKANDLASIGSYIELRERFDHVGWSLRMSLLSEIEARMPFSYHWRKSVTPLGLSWWALMMSGRHTDANGSGLWPTATVEGNNNRKGLSERSGDGLRTAVVSHWPTPQANGAAQRRPEDCVNKDGQPPRPGDKLYCRHNGKMLQSNLETVIKAWPTPNAGDCQSPVSPETWRRSADRHQAKGVHKQASLRDVARWPVMAPWELAWPTPKARDWKAPGVASELERHSPGLPVAIQMAGQQDRERFNSSGNIRGRACRLLYSVFGIECGRTIRRLYERRRRGGKRRRLSIYLSARWTAQLMGYPPNWCGAIR